MPKRQYIMTREERLSAVEALKQARDYLWDGNRNYENKTEFICVAAYIGQLNGGERSASAEELINRSLGDVHTFKDWLHKHVPGSENWTSVKVQKQRARWLEHLIKALERSLK